jgi:hypothetical protein
MAGNSRDKAKMQTQAVTLQQIAQVVEISPRSGGKILSWAMKEVHNLMAWAN